MVLRCGEPAPGEREPRVVSVSTRTSSDYKTILVIEAAGLTTPVVGALSDARKAFRRREDLAVEFLIVKGTGDDFVEPPGRQVRRRW